MCRVECMIALSLLTWRALDIVLLYFCWHEFGVLDFDIEKTRKSFPLKKHKEGEKKSNEGTDSFQRQLNGQLASLAPASVNDDADSYASIVDSFCGRVRWS